MRAFVFLWGGLLGLLLADGSCGHNRGHNYDGDEA